MKFFKYAVLTVVALAAVTASYMYLQLNSSLATLEGTVTSASISNTTVVRRDDAGVPTIEADNRQDAAWALGFLHGQERFFQMDLLRRNAAGELSALFGELAVKRDTKRRTHRFRTRAEQYLKALPLAHQQLLRRYADGVNQGLTTLDNHPFEYLLLSVEPTQWKPEDSLLSIYSMYLDLQSGDGRQERVSGLLAEQLPEDIFRFFHPNGTHWDAPIDGAAFPPVTLPTSKPDFATSSLLENAVDTSSLRQPDATPGSNNWVIAGELTTTGSAMIAGDMHLGLSAPTTWYRAQIRYPKNNRDNKASNDVVVTGVTLPGAPAIISGSNQRIAWAFTNSYGDWSDVIELNVDESGEQYLTPEGYKPFKRYLETIEVKGKPDQTTRVLETIWGPVIQYSATGKPEQAYRWVAHDREGINMNLLHMETASNVFDAVQIATTAGIPAQNMVVGDTFGQIAWTIFGAIPAKKGLTGQVPSDWSDGATGWSGYLDAESYPQIISPDSARIWTANSRVVGGKNLETLGNGGYALGARSQQIRDNLFAKERFTEHELLAIQLDDKAVFLTRWQQFLSELMQNPAISQQLEQSDTIQSLLKNWEGKASTSSVGYNLVRQFRYEVAGSLFADLEKRLESAGHQELKLHAIRHQLEEPVWLLINKQPADWLPSAHQSWDSFFVAALNKALSNITNDGETALTDATWGEKNATRIKHPLARAVPALSWLLDMPVVEQNGDSYMPKVSNRSFGASQRMVIAPSHEDTAIYHMPGGQSGHPLSPFYESGFMDWAEGNASPFLPGATRYILTIEPEKNRT